MSTDEKTVWLFYYISDEPIWNTDKNDLYAFTSNKKDAKDFINTRNMKKFYMQKERITTYEFNRIYENNINKVLEEFEGSTRSKNYKFEEFSIILTRTEKIRISSLSSIYTNEKIYSHVWENPNLFKNKYRKALMDLLFTNLHDYLTHDTNELMYNISIGRMKPDHLNIILSEYKNLFL